jgi:hypothetical protein
LIQVLVSFEESVTHHLNKLSLTVIQQTTDSNVLSAQSLDVFTQYCDDLYSSGVGGIHLNISNKILLKLRSTSIAIVGFVQLTKVKTLFKVLFDSGSDKLILKQSNGKKRKVSCVNASLVIDQDVLLRDITLPEFFSSQCIPGPICT